MPAFLAPLIGVAARVAGPAIARAVGPAALRGASRMDLPSTTRHDDEAMAIANPKPTLGQKLTKGMQFLGLTE